VAVNVNSYFKDLQASPNLGNLAKRGGVASIASIYGRGVLQILGSIVLARLLTPQDFGLVAIVMVLTRFAPLMIDFGIADATTQRSRITQSQCSALFWLSSGIGFAVALGLAVCSPLIAWVYQEPRLQTTCAIPSGRTTARSCSTNTASSTAPPKDITPTMQPTIRHSESPCH
jgi:Polysaccharide biosynthesis protein